MRVCKYCGAESKIIETMPQVVYVNGMTEKQLRHACDEYDTQMHKSHEMFCKCYTCANLIYGGSGGCRKGATSDEIFGTKCTKRVVHEERQNARIASEVKLEEERLAEQQRKDTEATTTSAPITEEESE